MDQCLNFKDLNHTAPQIYLLDMLKFDWHAPTTLPKSCLKTITFPVAWVSLVYHISSSIPDILILQPRHYHLENQNKAFHF